MKKSLSLRTRILLVFLSVVLCIIAVFFGMNHFFWKRVYVKSNERDIMTAYEDLSQMVRSSRTREADFIRYAASAKNGKNINFALQGEADWEFMIFTNQTNSPYERNFLLGL